MEGVGGRRKERWKGRRMGCNFTVGKSGRIRM